MLSLLSYYQCKLSAGAKRDLDEKLAWWPNKFSNYSSPVRPLGQVG